VSQTRRVGFIGPIVATIGGQLAGQLLEQLIRIPQVPVTRENVRQVEPYVETAANEAVRKEVIPRIEHLTNNEPWYQSRVTLGAIAAIISGILALLWYNIDEQAQSRFVELALTLGPIILPVLGGSYALIGRWISRKPIGM
jgi:hypothetical protein